VTAAIQCRALKSTEIEEYLRFAHQAWGRNSVQAQRSHLQWLYEENPNSRGMEKDLIVLMDGDRIVGAHHRMRLRWSINGHTTIVPSLHDLFVLESHRGGGGMQLVLAALAGESTVALFGLVPVSDQIYARLRVPTLQLHALRKFHSRFLAVAQLAAAKLHMPRRTEVKIPDAEVLQHGYTVKRTSDPNSDLLRAVVELRPQAEMYADWDASTYRWRFFHKFGPQSVLFAGTIRDKIVGRAVVSVGYGSRWGIVVARIVDLAYSEPEVVPILLDYIDRTVKSVGVQVSYGAISSTELMGQMLANGWSKLGDVGARWFSRGRGAHPEKFWVSGGECDFGCYKRVGSS
jgi:Acetyltransferase (GNAT) domain